MIGTVTSLERISALLRTRIDSHTHTNSSFGPPNSFRPAIIATSGLSGAYRNMFHWISWSINTHMWPSCDNRQGSSQKVVFPGGQPGVKNELTQFVTDSTPTVLKTVLCDPRHLGQQLVTFSAALERFSFLEPSAPLEKPLSETPLGDYHKNATCEC